MSCELFPENAKQVPDVEDVPGRKGIELSITPIELKGGDWATKIVPWIGGRIISMTHIPSGIYICRRKKKSSLPY